tara:strand:+ start:447 stop:713 length:267 start_codon:yes stop_codon:yes gene_type:complete
LPPKASIKKILIGAILLPPVSPVIASSIDSTSMGWHEGNSAPYENSITNSIDGIDVTATAGPTAASLYHDTADGLGVRHKYLPRSTRI